jgi:hypothetical protein
MGSDFRATLRPYGRANVRPDERPNECSHGWTYLQSDVESDVRSYEWANRVSYD